MIDLNSIILGDAEEKLKLIDDESIDLVVTSPPYDNLRKYNGIGDSWNHDKFKAIANELKRVLKRGGVIVWNVNDKTEKGSETGTSFRQALYFMDIGLNLNDTMIWEKSNPLPQVKQPRYNQVFEYMFVFSKGSPKTFNPIMVPCKCAGQNYDSTCKNMGGENGRTESISRLIMKRLIQIFGIWLWRKIKQSIRQHSQWNWQSDILNHGQMKEILSLTHF